MLGSTRFFTRSSVTSLRLSVLSFILVFTILLWSSHRAGYTSQLVSQNRDGKSEALIGSDKTQSAAPSKVASSENDEFWNTVLSALEHARPQCPPISYTPKGLSETDKKHEPLLANKPHPRNINMTDQAEKELMRTHYSMRRAAFRLGPKIPYAEGTTGIVATSNPTQMVYLLVSLRMLRKTGSQLPVELFLADESEYDAKMCEEVLPALNARCIVMSTVFSPKIEHFQYKIFAILQSSFQNVLFLDSDAFPVHDPTPLFSTRPYTSHGLVIWPDAWGNTASAHFYHIAGIPEVPVSTRPASETGQVLLDKSKHRESLLMSVYYNFYGPSHYYAILAQGGAGIGDKDTFIQGAMAVGVPFYTVQTGWKPLGRWGGSGGPGYHMVAMAQIDPAGDFLYGPPIPNHLHEKNTWTEDDRVDSDDAKDEIPKEPLPIFVHQMIRKFRPNLILQDEFKPHKSAEDGWQRIWASEEDTIKMFGHDAEKDVWEVLEQLSCVDQIQPEACEKLKEFRSAVFGK